MRRGFPWALLLFVSTVAASAAALARAAGGGDVPWWALGAIAGALLISVGGGVFLLGAGLFARPLLGVVGGRAAGRLALTFDDGPDPTHTRAVLDLLDGSGHRATFFVIGARAAQHPALLAEIVARGHQLGNHSFAHARTTTVMPTARLAADLARAQTVIAGAGGVGRWFRPPVGLLSPRVVEAARRERLELVGWTASARDGARGATVASATARLLRAIAPGAILVLHDGVERGERAPLAAAVLPSLLAAMAARGLKSVTLDELVG
jgi:peptidoglycan/xylan/chitin deacetylase (PgdA/CDA1 family)